MRKDARRNTKLTHSGSHPSNHSGIVNPPIYRASTVDYGTVAKMGVLRKNPNDNFVYGRIGTPTSKAFEEAVASLEGAERTIAVGSGLAAISAAMLAFVKTGDHILVCDNAYSPTRNLSEKFLKRFGVETTYYDPLIGSAIYKLFQPNFGSNIRALLFEQMNPITVERIKIEVLEAVERHEPRAVVIGVTVEAQEEQNRYVVSVLFNLSSEAQPQKLETVFTRP